MENNLIPRPEHPQPMFKRENWQNLNGEWLFEFDFGISGVERGLFKPEKADEYTKKITVPFCPESEEEFFARYEGLVSALLDAPNIMGFCYTRLYGTSGCEVP